MSEPSPTLPTPHSEADAPGVDPAATPSAGWRTPDPEHQSVLRILGRTRTLLWTALVLSLVVAVGVLGYQLSLRQGMAALRTQASHRLDLFASALEGMLNRLEHVPATLQLNRDVLALLQYGPGPGGERTTAVNGYLRDLNAQLGCLAVYVLNERGTVVASSNSADQGSFMGEDLSFRPYFLDALSGQVGRHFAIGNTSGQPGYYLSNPVKDGARVVGVAVIKISLAPIDHAWSRLGVPALIADENHVVILASQPEWLYNTLLAPPLDKRVEWQMSQRYHQLTLPRLPLSPPLTHLNAPQLQEGQVHSSRGLGLRDASNELLLQVLPLSKVPWQLLTFTDLGAVRKQAVLVSLLSCVAAAFCCLLWLVVQQRHRLDQQKLQAKRQLEQANARLEGMVAQRTLALIATNEQLRLEVQERVQAERTLRAAQDELVQAAKLAVLGQLSTGITHELSQPLGAIRTLTSNTLEFLKRGTLGTVESNLNVMARLVDQMGTIVHQLKGFARKSPAVPRCTDVAQTVSNALLLFASRLRTESVTLHNHCQEGLCLAWCDPNRLEQVVVNLMGNALDAMRDAPTKVLTLVAQRTPDGQVWLSISDTGSGISDALLPRLFEPFVTTKPVGIGLGLGLAISRDIVREFHGDLIAHNRAEGGATFVVQLPALDQAPPAPPAPSHTPSQASPP